MSQSHKPSEPPRVSPCYRHRYQAAQEYAHGEYASYTGQPFGSTGPRVPHTVNFTSMCQIKYTSIIRMKIPRVQIYILCFNEAILLPHTIQHYKTMLPHSKITIYDNESSDDSVKIAKSLGCKVISFSSKGFLNDMKQSDIKNNCWKGVKKGWIITLDMDEWLCVSEKDLLEEEKKGTTILSVKGYNMLSQSKDPELKDVNLHLTTKALAHPPENKALCFRVPDVKEMNYDPGAHHIQASGNIKYSSKEYVNKHMSSLGLPFLIKKHKARYTRAREMRKNRMAKHYTQDEVKIKNEYLRNLKDSYNLRCDTSGYCFTRKLRK